MRQLETPQPPSTNPTAMSRARANHYSATTRPGPLDDNCNGSPVKGKTKPASLDVKLDPAKNRRSMVLKRAKSAEEETPVAGSLKGRPANRAVAEQFARPRRPVSRMSEEAAADDKRKKVEELEDKLVVKEALIKDLQTQLLCLKAEMDEVRSSNAELELNNKKLSQDLASTEAKLSALASRDKMQPVGEHQSPKFKDIRKLIASKLEQSKVKREVVLEPSSVQTRLSSLSPSPPQPPMPKFLVPQLVNAEKIDPTCSPILSPTPPPPPPPPPSRPPASVAPLQKAIPIVQFYQLLKKQDGRRDPPVSGNQIKPVASSIHSSIVGEIQNRSAHLLAIKMDIETKGDVINSLIQKVLAASYMNIEDVLKFVDWLDGELASLADERAVLKHFKWPERKADAMREAAVEYRDLRKLESELSSYVDDPSVQCEVALKKMASLLDKSEQRIQRLVRLQSSAMRCYQDFKIPVDWMLDSGMTSKIKQASMKLAKACMKRVTMELGSSQNLDRESTQEALLIQGVSFAYRTHQFAGGLDSETLCALEEIRQRVPGHLRMSQELLAGIPFS